MPYIKTSDRERFKNHILWLSMLVSKEGRPGELNYIISSLLNLLYENARYADYNEAVGVLECAKLELYRRKIAPYEDGAIERNGDVYVPTYTDPFSTPEEK